jgi:chromosome partition protein MukF
MNPSGSVALNAPEAAQQIIAAGVPIQLEPRDVALLCFMLSEMRSRATPSLSLRLDEIRALSRRVNALEGRDSAGAEKVLTESLNRLMRSEAIVAAGVSRLRNAEDAEFGLTALGEAITDWHVARSRFDGAPLAAVLRAFNVHLEGVLEESRRCQTAEDWGAKVVLPLQAVGTELLSGVQRHQRSLDREHERIRDFIPSMLRESSETSLAECETVLASVVDTIRDLYDVTLGVSTAAFGNLQSIQEAAAGGGMPAVVAACGDIERRLEAVVDWTTQRQQQWGQHHDVVHAFMRSVIRVDRARRITEALKRAVADPPGWTFAVAADPPLYQFRELGASVRGVKRALVRDRLDHVPAVEDVEPEHLAQRLRELALESLAAGRMRWTAVASAAAAEGATTPQLVKRLPALMAYAIALGRTTPGVPALVKVTDGLDMQELEISER